MHQPGESPEIAILVYLDSAIGQQTVVVFSFEKTIDSAGGCHRTSSLPAHKRPFADNVSWVVTGRTK